MSNIKALQLIGGIHYYYDDESGNRYLDVSAGDLEELTDAAIRETKITAPRVAGNFPLVIQY